MINQESELVIKLPNWLVQYEAGYCVSASIERKMSFVINAAKQNIEEKTGGPFAAAIFEKSTGSLISIGVNLVTSCQNSVLHAEVVAIMLAEKKVGSFDLSGKTSSEYELVSSSSPCAMCVGAIHWSGVSHLVYGASVEDACAIGFDEGPISETWQSEFKAKGIGIEQVKRDDAKAVLQQYIEQGGAIYNPKF